MKNNLGTIYQITPIDTIKKMSVDFHLRTFLFLVLLQLLL
jgi:hypothetical protein